jgi:TolB protein
MNYRWILARTAALVALCGGAAWAQGGAVGIFEARGDVGVAPLKGSVEFNAATGEYRVTGGGVNLWGVQDGFYFLWQRIPGDFTLTADVRITSGGETSHQHRKAVLMARQELTQDSAYADAAVHGDGSTALQFRAASGKPTEEIKPEATAPTRLRLERIGKRFTMFYGKPGEALKMGGATDLELMDPIYVGIAVCAHKTDVLETAVFSNVKLERK